MKKIEKNGFIVIISGPPGVGKDTISNILTEKHGFKKLTSYTTRQKRTDDKEGDYYFLTEEEYFVRLGKNEFIYENPVKRGLSNEEVIKRINEYKNYMPLILDYDLIIVNQTDKQEDTADQIITYPHFQVY